MTEYDLAERPMRIEGREGSNHLYTAEVTYDGYGHSSGFREQVGTNRTIYNTAITYDTAGRVTKCSFTNGSVAYTYDGVGRIATKSITAGTYTDTCTYSYLAGGYGTGSTTGLITSQSQGNESCTYTFDTLGECIALLPCLSAAANKNFSLLPLPPSQHKGLPRMGEARSICLYADQNAGSMEVPFFSLYSAV